MLKQSKVILKLIPSDQIVFMPDKNAAFNLRLFMNLKTHDVGSCVIVSLAAANAFNSVEWECLHRYGFGPKFIKWVQLLY